MCTAAVAAANTQIATWSAPNWVVLRGEVIVITSSCSLEELSPDETAAGAGSHRPARMILYGFRRSLPTGLRGEGLVEGVDEHRHLGPREGQRRPDLEHVAGPASRADEHTAVAHPVADGDRRRAVGLRAAGAETGLPPNVLKRPVRPTAACTTSVRVITAATGCPLPIGLPSVTTSGSMPKRENAHSTSPVRPWPDCTSSATH